MQYVVISKDLRQGEKTLERFSYFEIRAENEQECEQLAAYVVKHKSAHGDVNGNFEGVPTTDQLVKDVQSLFTEQQQSDFTERLAAYKTCVLSSYGRTRHDCTEPFRVQSVRYAFRGG